MTATSTMQHHDTPTSTQVTPLSIGVVNFLNTLPLISGLSELRNIELQSAVPSQLIDLLTDGSVELALCSTIDYQRSAEPLVFVPAGQLGCAGPTLTVRLYSRSPLESLESVWCDTDSHTSVVLMRILLDAMYGISPELVSWDAKRQPDAMAEQGWPEAMLLIGDKVVTNSPPAVRYPYQLDLGDAWMRTTGLPFVFAMWVARAETDEERLRTAAKILDRQRRFNMGQLDRIIALAAREHHWPRDLAEAYLRDRLRFAVSPDSLRGLSLFFEKAQACGAIETLRPVRCLEW